MSNKRANVLREYHLLIQREGAGFMWQIRYDRHANPIQRSQTVYPTQAEALAAGEVALAALKRDVATNTP